MAFAGFNEDTLNAIKEQGGLEDGKTKENVTTKDLPDIKLVDEDDTQTGKSDAEIKKAAEAEQANKDAEAKAKEDADKQAKDKAEQDAVDLNSDEQINKTLTDADFNLDDIKARVIKDGGISEALKEELKAKIDPKLVDSYVETFEKQVAEAQKPKAEPNEAQAAANKAKTEMNEYIYKSIGGEDTFKVMAEAIAGKLDKDSISKINSKLDSTNKALVKEGLEDAVKAYNNITGRGQKRMEGDPNATADADKFEFVTKREYQAAIVSDKYKSDPVYAEKMDENRLKSKQLDSQQTMPGQYHNIRNGKRYAL